MIACPTTWEKNCKIQRRKFAKERQTGERVHVPNSFFVKLTKNALQFHLFATSFSLMGRLAQKFPGLFFMVIYQSFEFQQNQYSGLCVSKLLEIM